MLIEDAIHEIWLKEIYLCQGQGWCTGIGNKANKTILIYYRKKIYRKFAASYQPTYGGYPVEIAKMGGFKIGGA